jgi:hypothetical protein
VTEKCRRVDAHQTSWAQKHRGSGENSNPSFP